MRINREGYIIISVTLLIFIGSVALLYSFVAKQEWCLWLWSTSAVLLMLWLFIALFFREPTKRALLRDDNLIYAPCDGEVVVTELVHEGEYLNCEIMQVSIFMSVANIHVNWLPVSGEVEYCKYHQGRFLVAWNPKSSTLNERTSTVIRCLSGERVLVRQIAGFIARRIVCYMKEGIKVEQNSKMGFIKFGSRVDILIPKSAELMVKIGDKTVGTETVIAKFK
ncbi:MAG: phosphatidylserine decarboxylase family protein [Rikenellaceae bacterium]